MNKYTIETRYSSNEKLDKYGRWARIIYYNGLEIAWITGYNYELTINSQLEDQAFSDVTIFCVKCYFPSSNEASEKFNTIYDAIDYVKAEFDKFKKKINE